MSDLAKARLRLQVIAELSQLVRDLGAGHAILLNDYQVANLRAAIHACGYASVYQDSPLAVLHTGDWMGELFGKLPYVEYRPNQDPGVLFEAARRWRPSSSRDLGAG